MLFEGEGSIMESAALDVVKEGLTKKVTFFGQINEIIYIQ